MPTFMSIAHLMSFAVGTGVASLVCLLLVLVDLQSEPQIFQVATLLTVTLAVFCPGLGLELIRRKLSPAVQACINWGDILIAVCITGLGTMGLFYFLVTAGLGLVILNPVIGWLSTLQDGLVLLSFFAGLSVYVALLVSLTLVFPFLFSVSFKEISTFELK